MTHKTETIMTAVLATVTGLTTTGANVKRGRDIPWPETVEKALSIYRGPNSEEGIDSGRSRWALTIYIEYHAKTHKEEVDTVLNQIDEEVTIAMLAIEHLGLPFVFEVTEGDDDGSEPDDAGDQPASKLRKTWTIRYSRDTNNPGL